MEGKVLAIGKLKQKYLLFDILSMSSDEFSSMIEKMAQVNTTFRNSAIKNYAMLLDNYKTVKKDGKPVHISFSNGKMQSNPLNEFYFICDRTSYDCVKVTINAISHLEILTKYKLKHKNVSIHTLALLIYDDHIPLDFLLQDEFKQ